jgi:signal transduction histidine kinase
LLTHLAGVAHDLRNPLAALEMSAALVRADQDLPPEPKMRRVFGVLERQVGRLTRMVQDLLDATRVEAGELALQLEERDLRFIVREVVDLLKDTSEIHELVVDVPNAPLVVRCDPMRIEQLLTNLVSNAIKYSPRGGRVEIDAKREGALARVSVSDHGLGIPTPAIERLWEPFWRVAYSDHSIPGAGLGLWTARRIALAHLGSISVQSEVGQGSTFTLSLPLVIRG